MTEDYEPTDELEDGLAQQWKNFLLYKEFLRHPQDTKNEKTKIYEAQDIAPVWMDDLITIEMAKSYTMDDLKQIKGYDPLLLVWVENVLRRKFGIELLETPDGGTIRIEYSI